MGITKARKSPHKTAYNKRVKKSIITKTPNVLPPTHIQDKERTGESIT